MTDRPGKAKRRKRSRMSVDDCYKAFRVFSRRTDRMTTGSHGLDPSQKFARKGTVTVSFEVWGGFGAGDDVMEAIRVLSGHKLPRKDNK